MQFYSHVNQWTSLLQNKLNSVVADGLKQQHLLIGRRGYRSKDLYMGTAREMDVPEWLSETSPTVWKALRFSTIAVCVLGILGNVSSLTVLGRHLNEIPGSRLLLALGIADLGVVTAVTARILAFVAYGYSQLTRVLEWWFLYCYYCSVYLTILLSVDRYMQSAKSMLLLRINYKRIVKIAILSILGAMLLVTLPHLLGNFIKYHHKPHMVIFGDCYTIADQCRHWEMNKKQDVFTQKYDCVSGIQSMIELNTTGAKKYRDMILSACRHQKVNNYTLCGQPISVQGTKFTPSISARTMFWRESTVQFFEPL